MTGSVEDLLPRLQRAGRLVLEDFLTFEIVVDTKHPDITDTVYDGFRFLATCFLAGKIYGNSFGVDIGFGDPMLGLPDEIQAPDHLEFIGVEPPRVRTYPLETHLAEKLHAYTKPRPTVNSRVKDLPDLALLGTLHRYHSDRLRAAFNITFDFRNTHPVPTSLPDPPDTWSGPYALISRTDGLAWTSLAAVTEATRRFLDPMLASAVPLVWSPTDWTWTDAPPPR